ncbi:MAG: hypothetical protein ABGW77_03225, partial [Campylobacterales bacterium]
TPSQQAFLKFLSFSTPLIFKVIKIALKKSNQKVEREKKAEKCANRVKPSSLGEFVPLEL